MEGLLVLDALPHAARMIGELQQWILDGSLKYEMEILDGLDRTTEAMNRLFHGQNGGVQLIRITPESR